MAKVDLLSQYGFYNSILTLANGQFLNIPSVLKSSLLEAFHFLSYQKDKAEQERIQRERNKKR